MPFTTAQLATQLNNPGLGVWAATTPATQGPAVAAFTLFFNNVQAWITANGGANPFGWNNVIGLTHVNGNQVVLVGPQGRAPFNDAFDDVRRFLANAAAFHLFKAAQNIQFLIRYLGRLG